ncbi:MAG: hypothetical protein FIB05_17705 [Betaproteobacteria bacterium]|nr:hypothetical protein [Betaproteobacteria bacterium]
MDEDRDILGKADALLRRHVPPRPGASEGADVPLLTELITPVGPAAAPSTHRRVVSWSSAWKRK